jgi:TrmH family RNA methyltransferase
MAIEWIRSTANPLLKEVRRSAARGGQTDTGECVLDTPHLLEEAVRAGLVVRAVLFEERQSGLVEKLAAGLGGARMVQVASGLLRGPGFAENLQGIVALAQVEESPWDQLMVDRALLAVLDGVQDPGNAGALARVAEAFGASGIVLMEGSVRARHLKTLRAAAGSLFRLPFREGVARGEFLDRVARNKLRLWVTEPRGGQAPEKIDWREACAVVIGSEAHGVSAEMRAQAGTVTIPTQKVESLNAAMAGAIVLYEAGKQRART